MRYVAGFYAPSGKPITPEEREREIEDAWHELTHAADPRVKLLACLALKRYEREAKAGQDS